MGLSRPSCLVILATAGGVAPGPSIAYAGLPGRRWIRKNTPMLTTSRIPTSTTTLPDNCRTMDFKRRSRSSPGIHQVTRPFWLVGCAGLDSFLSVHATSTCFQYFSFTRSHPLSHIWVGHMTPASMPRAWPPLGAVGLAKFITLGLPMIAQRPRFVHIYGRSTAKRFATPW